MLRISIHIVVFCSVISGSIFVICGPIGKDVAKCMGEPGYSETGFQDHTRQTRYAHYEDKPKWDKADLTWTFKPKNLPKYIPERSIRSIIKNALNMWSTASGLKFHEISSNWDADLQISFEKQIHKVKSEECKRFTESAVAHAFAPYDTVFKGQLHINIAKTFTIGNDLYAHDLFQTVLHELGHALGLSHSESASNTLPAMWSIYQRGHPNYKLQQDDIDGIQALYKDLKKKKPPTSTRYFKFLDDLEI